MDKLVPRSYQLEILEQAKIGNVIACLGTGMGKTLISLLLMKSRAEFLGQQEPKRIFVFLVPTVHLAHQQKKFISDHSDFKVREMVGGEIDTYGQLAWEQEIKGHHVLVMTPQIFLNGLHHNFINLECIDTLIFDECHHAHNDHPYALIMKDFFHNVHPSKQPKIFGMTASPVEKKGVKSREHCAEQLQSLESMMNAKLVTVQDMAGVVEVVADATEHVCVFGSPTQSSLVLDLLQRLDDFRFHVSQKYQSSSYDIPLQKRVRKRIDAGCSSLVYSLVELGRFCAYKTAAILLAEASSGELDQYEEDLYAREIMQRARKEFLAPALELLRCQLDESSVERNEHKSLQSVKASLKDSVSKELLTPKVEKLVLELLIRRLTAKENEAFHCIVFVERVVTARVLCQLLNILVPNWVKAGFLSGCHNKNVHSTSSAVQKKVLDSFRAGSLNVLVSTSVAEEGLHVQQCNAVIVFDMCKTVRSYIQSKGRARAQRSAYVVFVESGSDMQSSLLSFLKESETLMREETINRTFPAFPAQPPLELEPEKFTIELTGASVDLHYSVPLVGYYCSQLPGDKYCTLTPEFRELPVGNGFAFEIRLPCNAPAEVQTTVGPVRLSKAHAKRSACFELVKKLHRTGQLNDYLLPAKPDRDLEVGQLRTRGASQGSLELMEVIPEVFKAKLHPSFSFSRPLSLFAFSITIRITRTSNVDTQSDSASTLKEGSVASMLLLIAERIHQDNAAAEVGLQLPHGVLAVAQLADRGTVMLQPWQVEKAKLFHSKLLSDSHWRCHVCGSASPPKQIAVETAGRQESPSPYREFWECKRHYLFLPLSGSASHGIVDWDTVLNPTCSCKVVHSRDGSPPDAGRVIKLPEADSFREDQTRTVTLADGEYLLEALAGMVIETTHNKCRYVVQGLSDWTALSEFPGPEYETYADFFRERHGCELQHKKQRLLLVRMAPKAKSFLAGKTTPSVKSLSNLKKAEVGMPPELCSVLYAGSIARAAQILPSVMHRLEGLELAAQLRDRLAADMNDPLLRTVSITKVLEALTCSTSLETVSLERLEMVGDSCLKYAVSCHLFRAHPSDHEGLLSGKRVAWVNNSNLMRLAENKGIKDYLRAAPLRVDQWDAPGVPPFVSTCSHRQRGRRATPGDRGGRQAEAEKLEEEEEGEEEEEDRTVLFAVAKKSVADMVEALFGVYWEELRGKTGLRGACKVMEWMGIPVSMAVADPSQLTETAGQADSLTAASLETVAEVEKRIGYCFRRKALVLEALTHASFPGSSVCYQRLEYLGDAVLDMLITRHLSSAHPDCGPGMLSELRSAAVNNETFAVAAVKPSLRLHDFLRHQSADLAVHITKYLQSTQSNSAFEHNFGDREETAPKVLGDILEALAGAVLVDCGYDPEPVWTVFQPLLEPIVTPASLRRHPVSLLHELCQSRGYGNPEYQVSPVEDTRVGTLGAQLGDCMDALEREGCCLWEIALVLDGSELGRLRHKVKSVGKKQLAATLIEKIQSGEIVLEKKEKCTEGSEGEGHGTAVGTDKVTACLESVQGVLDEFMAGQPADSEVDAVEDEPSPGAMASPCQPSPAPLSALPLEEILQSVRKVDLEYLQEQNSMAAHPGSGLQATSLSVNEFLRSRAQREAPSEVFMEARMPAFAGREGMNLDRQGASWSQWSPQLASHAEVDSVARLLRNSTQKVAGAWTAQPERPEAVQPLDGHQPVSALTELCAKRKWQLTFVERKQTGMSHDPTFEIHASVVGFSYGSAQRMSMKCSGIGGSKKEAKRCAALQILTELRNMNQL